MLDAAAEYAVRGWPVFPIKFRGKEPLTEHGFLDATTDLNQVEAWWTRWPDANIGAACGHAFDVLDVDEPGGSTVLLDMLAEHGHPRDAPRDWTARARTGGGGGHYFFQPGGPVRWRGFRPHLDWLGLRGYVILPPSIHPSGVPYLWQEGPYTADRPPEAFPPAPAWLHKAVTRPVREARPPRDPGGDPEGRPGNDFNRRMLWGELLEADGARLERRQGDVEYWTRPGKARGISASVGGGGHDLLYVFSGNWPKLDADTSYSKFAYWAATRHGGDFSAAARDLAGQGYGEQRQQQREDADPLGALLEAMGAYLHLDDPDHVLFALAVAVSADLDGPPLWGMLLGAPSGGKTEAIEILHDRGAHLDELSNAGLLGWKLGKGKGNPPVPGGALIRLGGRGLLTISDMSTLLARVQRSGTSTDQLFSNLRRVHDGALSRDITPPAGAVGELRWPGRATLLAACTPAIDRYAGHAEQLGPRWVYFRLRKASRAVEKARQQKVLDVDQLEERRSKARRLASQIVDRAIPRACGMKLSQAMAERTFDAAQVACWGRGAVPRHDYGRREIDGFPVIEATPRITGQLLLLARCLLALGQSETETLRLVRRAALGSISENRSRALAALTGGAVLTGRELAGKLQCHISVAIRTAEDLAALGLVEWPDDPEETGDGFPPPKLWGLTADDETRELVEAVLDEEAFCLVAPVREVDFHPPPTPPQIKKNGQDRQPRGTPQSTSRTGLTSDDAPPPLSDRDLELFDAAGYGDPGGWSR